MCTDDGLYCLYNNFYLNGSSSGVVSTETFAFPADSKSTWKTTNYSNLVFGCGFDNHNMPFATGPNNVIAGVFGLNLGRQSMLVQLQAQTKRRFTYCLSSLETPTLLQLGDDASATVRRRRSGLQLQTTSLERGLDHYYVTMLGISIGNQRLKIDPEVFKLIRGHIGGFLVDTGSPYSFIAESAFRILRGEMVEYIARRYSGLRPMQRGIRGFKLCYNLTTSRIRYVFLSMTFHFKQADYVMRPEVVFQCFGTVRCLVMLAIEDEEPSILGAFQQTNYRFLFDGGESKLSFVPENCA
ncbi:Aspartic peptidase [Trema orientale]|uniref:Aspartic peptidase n=1 Tax=Trema orientale TaxID=63057 RepID=A0A2P5D8A5_TREOI|nr:Aspartic peptidase [Trema orientale]